jgi:hypothetical protein
VYSLCRRCSAIEKIEDRLWEAYRLSPDAGFGIVVVAGIMCLCDVYRAIMRFLAGAEGTK